ncbi:hypothetical protein OCS_06141 [Ophiocordyceps sinensis CO18]|uniref:Uncharacterized protein n=1 Tax=Ophiocordyceps sinensis (strain Co18 / CGMCC 3.14243) TaxID=911162 RepID=T4ZYE5_OPHSC|nr:hypothetical protein OCS_06141 [Ophiocordyceps sinensis CO18]
MMQSVSSRRVGIFCDLCAIVRVRAPSSLSSLSVSPLTRRPCKSFIRKPVSTRWISAAVTSASADPRAETKQTAVVQRSQQMPDANGLAEVAEDSRNKFLSVDGIPAPRLTIAALQSCLRAAAALHPQLKRAEAQSRASASRLVALGAERTGARLPIDARLQDAISRISHSAYEIITNRNVEMTPEFLELYVQVQAQLGRPESLPSVLDLYALKPKPTMKNGMIKHVRRNPNSPMRAIEIDTAELALQTAIEARNLDSALGIIEAAYCGPAFRRQKLIKYTTAPALGVASLPFGIYGLSTAYATYCQNTMDLTTATGLAFAVFSTYFFVVGSLGLIAKLCHMDHMKRVTWAPGTPLRYRWMREEERAALDKVACAWGFRESFRYGEETGPEWEGLKEYMGYRQMLLDRVEFMEGMS